MEMSTFIFNYDEPGPTNAMVDLQNDCNIAIVNWEAAGYVLPVWVRTEVAGCGAMDIFFGEETIRIIHR